MKTVDTELGQHQQRTTTDNNEHYSVFKVFKFKMDEIEGFRYRARDVLRSITSVAIKEARIKEIKNELLNSEKLKASVHEYSRIEYACHHSVYALFRRYLVLF
jgi:ATP-dependent RNA helicase DDX56/DBP9